MAAASSAAEARRSHHDVRLREAGVLGIPAEVESGEGEHAIPRAKPAGGLPDSLDLPRDHEAENRISRRAEADEEPNQGAKQEASLPHRGSHIPIARVDRRRIDPDEDLTVFGDRLFDVLDLQYIGRTVP